jgi:predicted NBD/HSP70 family sugar kinase
MKQILLRIAIALLAIIVWPIGAVIAIFIFLIVPAIWIGSGGSASDMYDKAISKLENTIMAIFEPLTRRLK